MPGYDEKLIFTGIAEPVDESGPKVWVEIAPSVRIRMLESEARAKGYLKEQPPTKNKMRRPTRDK